MFFTRFYYLLSLDDGRIRLGIKRNWNETEHWLEKRSTPSLLHLLRHLRKGNARIYRFFHRIPFRRICLSGKKFMSTVVNPQHWKQSLLPFLCCHARIASGEIILLTDNELLAFTWGSRKVKTERLYQF
jgi:hypothetical protein